MGRAGETIRKNTEKYGLYPGAGRAFNDGAKGGREEKCSSFEQEFKKIVNMTKKTICHYPEKTCFVKQNRLKIKSMYLFRNLKPIQ